MLLTVCKWQMVCVSWEGTHRHTQLKTRCVYRPRIITSLTLRGRVHTGSDSDHSVRFHHQGHHVASEFGQRSFRLVGNKSLQIPYVPLSFHLNDVYDPLLDPCQSLHPPFFFHLSEVGSWNHNPKVFVSIFVPPFPTLVKRLNIKSPNVIIILYIPFTSISRQIWVCFVYYTICNCMHIQFFFRRSSTYK